MKRPRKRFYFESRKFLFGMMHHEGKPGRRREKFFRSDEFEVAESLVVGAQKDVLAVIDDVPGRGVDVCVSPMPLEKFSIHKVRVADQSSFFHVSEEFLA